MDNLGALSRSVRSRAAEAYAGFEVGPTQARFLRHIGSHSGISQADLARATLTDPALTGRTLEALIARGWVRRFRSEQDRRQYVLELSASGKRMRERVEKARAAIAEELVALLGPQDLADFERISRKVVGAWGEPSSAETSRSEAARSA
jgi:DNA-binding MarR family transcriptional regulator